MSDNQFADPNMGWARCPTCGGRKQFIRFKGYRCPTCEKIYDWHVVKNMTSRTHLPCGHAWDALILVNEVVPCPECGGTGLRG